MSDDTVNQTARRVAVHQAVDGIVDARRQRRRLLELHGEVPPPEALSEALDHLSAVALGEDLCEHAWRALAAIAQGQLEEAMEERAS